MQASQVDFTETDSYMILVLESRPVKMYLALLYLSTWDSVSHLPLVPQAWSQYSVSTETK